MAWQPRSSATFGVSEQHVIPTTSLCCCAIMLNQTIRPRSLIDAFGWTTSPCFASENQHRDEERGIWFLALRSYLFRQCRMFIIVVALRRRSTTTTSTLLPPVLRRSTSPPPPKQYYGFSTPPRLHHRHIEREWQPGWETPSAQQHTPRDDIAGTV